MLSKELHEFGHVVRSQRDQYVVNRLSLEHWLHLLVADDDHALRKDGKGLKPSDVSWAHRAEAKTRIGMPMTVDERDRCQKRFPPYENQILRHIPVHEFDKVFQNHLYSTESSSDEVERFPHINYNSRTTEVIVTLPVPQTSHQRSNLLEWISYQSKRYGINVGGASQSKGLGSINWKDPHIYFYASAPGAKKFTDEIAVNGYTVDLKAELALNKVYKAEIVVRNERADVIDLLYKPV